MPESSASANVAEPARHPRPELTASLRADLELRRHPSDGGGLAWLEPRDGTAVVAGRPGRFEIVYEAAGAGVVEGGTVFLQVSPFWGWSTPQTTAPDAPGYTEVTTTAAGVELTAETLDRQLLGIRVGGRGLRAGERLRIVYGAGPAGAVADRYAEHGSRFWIAVDGDGDGVRQVLADSPAVDVVPGPAARLVLLLPSTARPGDEVELSVAVLDGLGSAGVPYEGEIVFTLSEGAVDRLPASLSLTARDAGRARIELTTGAPGTVRIAARAGPFEAESNPLQVSASGSRILWGDLQNHSNLSDGTGSLEDQFLYARDVAALDVYALTDHDHWGLLFLDQHPGMWERIGAATERFHQPGRFVTLLGYEWTNWIHGHRHVLYFDSRGAVLSSLDPEVETPQQLWEALRGRRALTVAHHSAGGPVSIDWSIPPDPELEPVTEIVSVHGSSEALDSPGVIYRPVPGNFVRDALDRGYRLGFVGSSDGHDGHPGLGHLASPSGGLAAILAEEATRDGVYEALKGRRAYATNGPRIVLRASYGGHPMGADVPVTGGVAAPGPIAGIPPGTLVVQVIAPGELDRVDLVRSGEVRHAVDCGGERDCAFGLEIGELEAGEYLYTRAVQRDGGAAWSSPFYFVDPES